MNSGEISIIKVPEMSDGQFQLFSELIYSICGINLMPKKKMMLVARLYRRLRELNIHSYEDYYNFILSPEGRKNEIINMINVVSTNKTQFFRDPEHFNYLAEKALPEFLANGRTAKNMTLNIWSAGCSTGEEPYTIAIVLSEYFGRNKLNYSFKIFATDISTRVLEIAGRAVYKRDTVSPIKAELLKKYFVKLENSDSDEYAVKPELKKNVEFRRFNLMENDFKLGVSIDIIFCRNVIIYFDKKTQIALFQKFYSTIGNSGYLFIGNSESLHNINDEFTYIVPAIYKKG